MEYSEKVIDHFTNPRNIGKLDNANGFAIEGSPACGDQVSFYLKINEETLKIDDVRFLSYGCASNIATASITSELVKGKSIEEAKKLNWKDIVSELDGLPNVKIHCSVLAMDALKNAIKKFEIDKGYIEPEPFTKQIIIDELKKIIHPCSGEDIITLRMVKSVSFENNIASISLELIDCDTNKEHVIGEIKEHLEKFPEIKEIKIN